MTIANQVLAALNSAASQEIVDSGSTDETVVYHFSDGSKFHIRFNPDDNGDLGDMIIWTSEPPAKAATA